MLEKKQESERAMDSIIELSELINMLTVANRNIKSRLDDGREQCIALVGCGGSRRDSVIIKSNRYATDILAMNMDLIAMYKKELAEKVDNIQ